MTTARRIVVRAAAIAVALTLLALLLASILVGWQVARRLPHVSDFWPLDLTEPGGWLLDRQLADLAGDRALCAKVLLPPHIDAKAVTDAAPREGCGWTAAVEVRKVARARFVADPVTCEVAAALTLWMEHVVQPAASATLGSRVTAIDHLGTYACRNIRGSPAFADHPSEHASANAVDVGAFRLADGRRISVLTDWGKDSAAGRFLSQIHAGSCRYFRVAIGPAYNAAHRNHFHFDRGRWRACR
ncbi:MAG: extensin family protein [Hyphomicrobiaceae bacterium]